VPALPSGPDESDGVAAHDLDGVVYVADDQSVIHDGDREIDVSPREVRWFTKTDDGFVFTDDRGVYFTDGTGVEPIGQTQLNTLVASDNSGSNVACLTPSNEVVVYDTSRQAVVARKALENDIEDGPPLVDDLDGHTVYLRVFAENGVDEDLLAWDFTGSGPLRRIHAADSVSDGYVLRSYLDPRTSGTERVIVSRNPDADEPRFPALESGSGNAFYLSPSGRYIVSTVDDGAGVRVTERETQRDVTPVMDVGYDGFGDVSYWIDDDRLVLGAFRLDPNDPEERLTNDLLVCSISAGSCELAVESVGEGELGLSPTR
jgi:hypothetical protein